MQEIIFDIPHKIAQIAKPNFPFVLRADTDADTNAIPQSYTYRVDKYANTVYYQIYCASTSQPGTGMYIADIHMYELLPSTNELSALMNEIALAEEPDHDSLRYAPWKLFHDWAYGRKSPHSTMAVVLEPAAFCKRCGEILTNPTSIARQYGDKCYTIIQGGCK